MFEELIKSVIEDIILSSGESLWQKIILLINKRKIKKELSDRIHYSVLGKHGDEVYYNSLDSFLTSEKFGKRLISYCYRPPLSPHKSIATYISYLLAGFETKYPKYSRYKIWVQEDLYSLAKIIFDTINDYSKDETARLVISNLGDMFNEHLEQLSKQSEKILKLIDERLPNVNRACMTEFYNANTINLYKTSLASIYIAQGSYIARNIITPNDGEQTSVDCLINRKRIVLLGDPGSGKTVEAIHVLRELCTNSAYESYIPIYMKLIEYGTAYASVYDYIKQQLHPYFGVISDELLTEALFTEKFIIILDGVDEIIDVQHRVKFFAEINRMLSSTKVSYFITSRINPYHGNIHNIDEYRIKDITQEQIRKHLIDNGINPSFATQYEELFVNPLFLQIGIQVLKGSNTKLYNKSQLFNAYIEEVCYRRDETKQLPHRVEKNYYRVLMEIGKLAFETFDKAYLTSAEFDEFFGANDKDYTFANICDIFRIDIFKVENNISFSHKQFKEFFAAYYISKQYSVQGNNDFYISLMEKEHWQEVMVFMAGLITDIGEQNTFLDMVLVTNLKTYCQCVKHKNNLYSSLVMMTHEEYATVYLKTLFDSYQLLLKTYFPNILQKFAPFKSEQEGFDECKRTCLVGSLSPDHRYLHFWFDWKDNSEPLIQLIPEEDIATARKELEKRAIIEGRNTSSHGTDLELSGLQGDSARQIVINIVYENIKDIIDKCELLESDYILYEKLCTQTKRIKSLKDKSIRDIADWATQQVERAYADFDFSRGGVLAGVHHNGVDIVNLMYIANYLDSMNGTHESLALPGPDLPLTSGWSWSVYSNERVKERLKMFFLWRQVSFHEMVEMNFPKMKDYFSLSKDKPYKYRIHLKFHDSSEDSSDAYSSNPLITYYRVSINAKDSIIPEIIKDDTDTTHSDDMFDLIRRSYHDNGKEVQNCVISSSGFSRTLNSIRLRGNMPLTEIVYDDLRKAFKEIFEQ